MHYINLVLLVLGPRSWSAGAAQRALYILPSFRGAGDVAGHTVCSASPKLNELLETCKHLTSLQRLSTVDVGTSEPWNGRRLVLPAHIHGRLSDERLPKRVDAAAQPGFSLDIQLNERSGSDWLFSREPRMTVPLRRCVLQSSWGLSALVPEVVLFYKAKEPRTHDELDFLALLPHLTSKQLHWLREAISLVQPDQPWLPQLS